MVRILISVRLFFEKIVLDIIFDLNKEGYV